MADHPITRRNPGAVLVRSAGIALAAHLPVEHDCVVASVLDPRLRFPPSVGSWPRTLRGAFFGSVFTGLFTGRAEPGN
jgi:hypothetical protein